MSEQEKRENISDFDAMRLLDDFAGEESPLNAATSLEEVVNHFFNSDVAASMRKILVGYGTRSPQFKGSATQEFAISRYFTETARPGNGVESNSVYAVLNLQPGIRERRYEHRRVHITYNPLGDSFKGTSQYYTKGEQSTEPDYQLEISRSGLTLINTDGTALMPHSEDELTEAKRQIKGMVRDTSEHLKLGLSGA